MRGHFACSTSSVDESLNARFRHRTLRIERQGAGRAPAGGLGRRRAASSRQAKVGRRLPSANFRPGADLRERLLSGKLLEMICRASSRKLALALLLAVSEHRAAGAPACVSEAASASTGVPNVPTPMANCPGNWASIKPAAFKEPIENPHRLGWREWTFLASGLGVVLILSAGAMRVARR
jgi:hypothetical protein